MQGWRVDMEDAHISQASLSERLSDMSLFAVFDGHAGKNVAETSAADFAAHLAKTPPFDTLSDSETYKEEEVKAGIREAFRAWDRELRVKANQGGRADRSGSTATGVLITPKDYFFFNAGDSRTLLVRNEQVEFATMDHKPTNEEEKKRIESAGGRVMIQRINGSLAVSRALGDFEYKNRDDLDDLSQLVSPDPDVTCLPRKSDADNFIVVACDGIYDVMSNEEIAEFCHDRLESSEDEFAVPETLLNLCLHKGSRDNMSVIIIGLNQYPKQNLEKIKLDNDLNAKIEKKLKEYLEGVEAQNARQDDFVEFVSKEDFVQGQKIGGVEVILAKRGFINRKFEEHFATRNNEQ